MGKKITKPTKYTAEYVLSELKNMVKELTDDTEIYLLGDLFESREYSMQRFSEWVEKFKDNSEISETIKKIKDTLEHRLNKKGLTNELNPTLTIFNLKNNYGWKDKKEIEDVTDKPKVIKVMPYDG